MESGSAPLHHMQSHFHTSVSALRSLQHRMQLRAEAADALRRSDGAVGTAAPAWSSRLPQRSHDTGALQSSSTAATSEAAITAWSPQLHAAVLRVAIMGEVDITAGACSMAHGTARRSATAQLPEMSHLEPPCDTRGVGGAAATASRSRSRRSRRPAAEEEEEEVDGRPRHRSRSRRRTTRRHDSRRAHGDGAPGTAGTAASPPAPEPPSAPAAALPSVVPHRAAVAAAPRTLPAVTSPFRDQDVIDRILARYRTPPSPPPPPTPPPPPPPPPPLHIFVHCGGSETGTAVGGAVTVSATAAAPSPPPPSVFVPPPPPGVVVPPPPPGVLVPPPPPGVLVPPPPPSVVVPPPPPGVLVPPPPPGVVVPPPPPCVVVPPPPPGVVLPPSPPPLPVPPPPVEVATPAMMSTPVNAVLPPVPPPPPPMMSPPPPPPAAAAATPPAHDTTAADTAADRERRALLDKADKYVWQLEQEVQHRAMHFNVMAQQLAEEEARTAALRHDRDALLALNSGLQASLDYTRGGGGPRHPLHRHSQRPSSSSSSTSTSPTSSPGNAAGAQEPSQQQQQAHAPVRRLPPAVESVYASLQPPTEVNTPPPSTPPPLAAAPAAAPAPAPAPAPAEAAATTPATAARVSATQEVLRHVLLEREAALQSTARPSMTVTAGRTPRSSYSEELRNYVGQLYREAETGAAQVRRASQYTTAPVEAVTPAAAVPLAAAVAHPALSLPGQEQRPYLQQRHWELERLRAEIAVEGERMKADTERWRAYLQQQQQQQHQQQQQQR